MACAKPFDRKTCGSITTNEVSSALWTANKIICCSGVDYNALIAIAKGSDAGDIGTNIVTCHLIAVHARALDINTSASIATNEISSAGCIATNEIIRGAIYDTNAILAISQGSGASHIGTNIVAT